MKLLYKVKIGFWRCKTYEIYERQRGVRLHGELINHPKGLPFKKYREQIYDQYFEHKNGDWNDFMNEPERVNDTKNYIKECINQ